MKHRCEFPFHIDIHYKGGDNVAIKGKFGKTEDQWQKALARREKALNRAIVKALETEADESIIAFIKEFDWFDENSYDELEAECFERGYCKITFKALTKVYNKAEQVCYAQSYLDEFKKME